MGSDFGFCKQRPTRRVDPQGNAKRFDLVAEQLLDVPGEGDGNPSCTLHARRHSLHLPPVLRIEVRSPAMQLADDARTLLRLDVSEGQALEQVAQNSERQLPRRFIVAAEQVVDLAQQREGVFLEANLGQGRSLGRGAAALCGLELQPLADPGRSAKQTHEFVETNRR